MIGKSLGGAFNPYPHVFEERLSVRIVQPIEDPSADIFDNADEFNAFTFVLEPCAALVVSGVGGKEGECHPDHEKQYTKYFEVKNTPVRGTKVTAREDAIAEAKHNYGYFALMSNEIKDPVEALSIYRNKDLVEKAFENLKDRLNLRRLAVSSGQSLDGKLFVQFIALIYLSYITRKMQENKLFKDHTMQEVLDDLDMIECFEVPGQKLQVGEITKHQSDLFSRLGITPPTSLQ